MLTQIYSDKKTFVKYDDTHFLVYLNEVIIPDYELTSGTETEDGKPVIVTGYQYTGTFEDGGTLIECTEPDRNSIINGIIRTQYSQTEEDAIKTHQIELLKGNANEKEAEYEQEWTEFNNFRNKSIQIVDEWLA